MNETIDTGALPVPGGYFIVRAGRPERTPFHRLGEPTDFRYSHTYAGGGSTTRDDLIELIDSAAEQVLVASYLIGDEMLCRALEKAAARLQGRVHVIVNLDGPRLSDDLDEALERRRFEALAAQGVTIRSYPGCHAKFAVIDQRVGLVHSANFMTRAFDTTGENGVVIRDPMAVADAVRFFEWIWRGALWEVSSAGAGEIVPRNPEIRALRTLCSPAVPGLIWTFHDEHLILDAIIDLIDSAEQELVLATFNVNGMSRRPELLHDPLRTAVARGVTVKLLMRARGGPEAGDEAAALQDLGVDLYPCSLNHAKGIVADRARGAMFSANFDARFGLDRDVELGVRLDGTAALADLLRFFEHSMAEHDRGFVRHPDARTLALGWGSLPFPAGERLDVTATLEDWKRLRDLACGPVIFKQCQGHLSLYAENQSWRLERSRVSGCYRLEAGAPQQNSAMSGILDGRAKESEVGICTAVFQLSSLLLR
ncbi:phospholipase D-like domain-containing protein [Glycomyces algeriensis]|uniref:phospholipase D-like domain-containing protein n=1 Tax=Glycomyces algeriensis TaxID=256037 RepID=UPI0022D2AF0E|nr:phospholipase D-like domain-containing protein [Glycomyces algeriensis]MDA1368010.1 phospholipase D-like domain-containing protein [Glycomyces algeriensis]MDR7352518.1 phosphatidylserine/phosphatidylglycerophosphate/cardiolipin synthase-like enzyme [Glycomyces algeriensis]